MSYDYNRDRHVPWWMLLIIIVAALPALFLPSYAAIAAGPVPESKKLFLWLYPFYLIVAGFLAWQCYGRRTVMSWILVVLMFMTDAAMYLLYNMN